MHAVRVRAVHESRRGSCESALNTRRGVGNERSFETEYLGTPREPETFVRFTH